MATHHHHPFVLISPTAPHNQPLHNSQHIHVHEFSSFYAVRPPLADGTAPASITSWAIFPSRPAADAYAATLELEAVVDGDGPADRSLAATIQGFGDALSAMVYASRGTAGVQSLVGGGGGGGGKKRKKKRKKRDRDGGGGGGGGSTAVYAAGTCDILASRLDGRQDPFFVS